MNQFELIDIVETNNTLGEGVLWDDRQQNVWWTDILESRIYRYDPVTRALNSHTLPERLTSFGFTEKSDLLVCAFASGFALYEPESKKIEWLARPEMHLRGTRLNDGRVDRQGRFWAGSMVEQQSADHEGGSLYCLTGRECKKIFGGIKISNSICWSPDSQTLYFADSPTHTIHRYAFDASSGIPGKPEIFTRITPPHEPDGSTVDAQGFLWNAAWGGGKVTRYDHKGQPVDQLLLPVTQPTCVAFGGSQMNLLFVSTARVGLTTDQLKQQPQAGNLFIYRTPYTGLPESRFRI
jgi:L-arabinonolactonase